MGKSLNRKLRRDNDGVNRQCHPVNEWIPEHWTLNVPYHIGNLYFECLQTIDSNSHNWKTRLNNNGKVWALSQTKKNPPKIVHTLWLHGHNSISTIRIRLKIVYHLSCFAHRIVCFLSTVFSKLNCLRCVLHCRVERQQIDENWWIGKWFKDAICGPLMEIAIENDHLFNAGMEVVHKLSKCCANNNNWIRTHSHCYVSFSYKWYILGP